MESRNEEGASSSSQVLKERVANYLLRHSHGMEQAVTVNEIAKGIGMGYHTTQPVLRFIITQLIEEGYCIGSCTKGFFFISNDEELKSCVSGLESRVQGIQNRIEYLKKGWSIARPLYDEVG